MANKNKNNNLLTILIIITTALIISIIGLFAYSVYDPQPLPMTEQIEKLKIHRRNNG